MSYQKEANTRKIAAKGRVKTHARIICLITDILAFLFTNPIPKSEPQDICVVETGIPHPEAKITRKAVTGFALKL